MTTPNTDPLVVEVAEAIDHAFDDYSPCYSEDGYCAGSNAAQAVLPLVDAAVKRGQAEALRDMQEHHERKAVADDLRTEGARAALDRILHTHGEARWEAQQHLRDYAEGYLDALLDEVDRLTQEVTDARSAAEEEAARTNVWQTAAREAARRLASLDEMRAIRTPAEADKTPAGTVLLDRIGDVWQHGVERQTLWEDRIDYWTTPGDEEGHDANEPAYPARIIHQPEEQQ